MDHCLSIEPNLVEASIIACQTLLAKLSRLVDSNASGISTSRSQRFTQLKDILEGLRMRGASTAVAPFFGGTSIAGKDAIEANTDFRQPAFKVGRDDIPGAVTDTKVFKP